jgi:hypothetical protein
MDDIIERALLGRRGKRATGRMAWVDGELRPETGQMAETAPGGILGNLVKSAGLRGGLDVWESIS